MPPKKGRGRGRGGGGGGRGGGRGAAAPKSDLSKTELYFRAIRNEETQILHWSLKHGGFTPYSPYDDEYQVPPFHLAVGLRKLKSLKCMLESIDRMRNQKAVDFQDHDGVSPLMLAAKVGWSEGVRTLLREDASLELKDKQGRNARAHAQAKGHTKIIDVINEWEREDDGPALTAGEAKKKKVHEEYKEKRAKEAKAAEAKDVAAKEAAWEEKDRIEKELASASTLASWDEVKEALSELKHELTVDRHTDEGATGVDPALWSCTTLNKLTVRLPKPALTAVPAQLGSLVAMQELILAHNSLTTLPASIASLVLLRVLDVEDNCLETLPVELASCTKLEVVKLTNNKLTSLASLSDAAEMTTLTAAHNEITAIDLPLETMPRLAILNLKHNALTEIPGSLGSLKLLTHLDCAENQITELPSEMANLNAKKVQQLCFDDNPIKDRKVKQIFQKSRDPVKELLAHLGGGKGGKGGKKKK